MNRRIFMWLASLAPAFLSAKKSFARRELVEVKKYEFVDISPTKKSVKDRVLLKDGFDAVKAAMQSDDGYALAWHCNIACAAMDEGVDHKTAQKIASRFMGWAFQVDTQRLV